MDTIIFILRKSDRQVTFLHVYHHCSVTFVTRTFIVYGKSGDLIVPCKVKMVLALSPLSPLSSLPSLSPDSVDVKPRSFRIGMPAAWLNAFIHVFMYSHYLCATFKVSLP